MFIIIPTILIGISIVGMVVIVRRKMPYLRKLSPEAHIAGDSLFGDFFPELVEWYGSINIKDYRQASLREIEKVLRRMRLVFLKIDHASDRLIKKVRHTHLTAELENTHEVVVPEPVVVPEISVEEDLKAREQQLIIDISQDPKNSALYETLGDLYMKMESVSDAKEAYEAALGFNPDNLGIARKYSALLKREEVTN
ncbi:MAG: hypothetical protein AAB638_00095 [Patescibacteria group bacterium]